MEGTSMGTVEGCKMGICGQRRVGILYDERMCKHFWPFCEDHHPEKPDRVRFLFNTLQTAGITQRCILLNSRRAEDHHLSLVHSDHHIDFIRDISSHKFNSERMEIAEQFNSIYFNEGSSEAAFLAAGSATKILEEVAKGELDSAFAIIRPPGHHAEPEEPMGFCLLNNVAIGAKFLLDERPELGISKILIVDWDVHHGNGTQKMFWNDSRVLFFSVHRHDFGTFYPANDNGSHIMIGEGLGKGFNINVPWESGFCGDADYIAAWDQILLPVTREFDPDIIIISAGFDAAVGDPLGGCSVTPQGYSLMLKKLMKFARGRIVMILEGGYNLKSLGDSALACVKVLLGDAPINDSIESRPFESSLRVIRAVRKELCAFWPTLADELPSFEKCDIQEVLHSESADGTGKHMGIVENIELPVITLVQPFSNMALEETINSPNRWRSLLSKVSVWYASYGSNMFKSRMLCYIQGGQLECMRLHYVGSVDKSPPTEMLWRTENHRLFFGRKYTETWGHGGVAFFDPERNDEEKTHMCLYRITLEQFNDVLSQENSLNIGMNSPLFGLDSLNLVMAKGSMLIESLKGCFYDTVVHLGEEAGIPILTITCSFSTVREFRSGKLALLPPSHEYKNFIIKGLVEGGQLSEEEANAYIANSSFKPL